MHEKTPYSANALVADRPPPRRRDAEACKRYEITLLRRYARTRSGDVRDELVKRFMPLARSLALRYRRQTESVDDLVQVASLGLVKAIDGFDPDRGRPFSAYAVPTILGELRRHFRDHVWNVRLPRGLGELAMRLDEASSQLTEELGRHPAPAQVAERLALPLAEVLEGLEATHARRTLSLDAPRLGEELQSTPTIEAIGRRELGYERVEAEAACAEAELSEREWRVLRLRFVDSLTQNEIGRELGVSQMQISRINRRALWKLLAAVRGERAEGAAPPSAGRRVARAA
ncbi:MAG: sigma-70 family RNA polymerase sigma factor [Solirubrobacterales bacterium]|nr:sigma-70 family RNA polymerase sigma factor [Solirubrobacterales bacterium]